MYSTAWRPVTHSTIRNALCCIIEWLPCAGAKKKKEKKSALIDEFSSISKRRHGDTGPKRPVFKTGPPVMRWKYNTGTSLSLIPAATFMFDNEPYANTCEALTAETSLAVFTCCRTSTQIWGSVDDVTATVGPKNVKKKIVKEAKKSQLLAECAYSIEQKWINNTESHSWILTSMNSTVNEPKGKKNGSMQMWSRCRCRNPSSFLTPSSNNNDNNNNKNTFWAWNRVLAF